MLVIPNPKLKVRDPENHDHLPPEGREVADTPYWRRRLRDQDVTLGKPAAKKPAAKKE